MKVRCNYCGAERSVPMFYLLFVRMFKDKYYSKCQVCHHVSCYRMFFRLVHDSTDSKEKEYQKLSRIWR